MKNFLALSLIVLFTISLQNCSKDKIDNNENEDISSETARRPTEETLAVESIYVIINYIDNVSFSQKTTAKSEFENNATFSLFDVYKGIDSNLEVWKIHPNDLQVIQNVVLPLPQVDDYNDTSVFNVFYTDAGLADRDAARDLLIELVAFEEQDDYDICIHDGCCVDTNQEEDEDPLGLIDYVELISNEDFKE